eukprot:Tbor_TRINITY_DN3957_c0_g1::TRINITY_DN3957_c0_g1_i1::g.697::m.697
MESTNGHSCVVLGNKIIRYGGKVNPTTLTDETVAMDLATNVWKRLVCAGQVPHPRAYHTAVTHGFRMYVFGGLLAVGLDDIHFNMYNVYANSDALSENILRMDPLNRFKLPKELTKVTQQKLEPCPLHCLDLEGQATWSVVPIMSGPQPPTRAHHAAVVYRNNMFIYGGYSVHTTAIPGDDELQAVYDTYSLDLDTMTWRVILPPKAHMDSPMLWGMASAVSGCFWILYGGVDIVQCKETAAVAILNLDDECGQWAILHSDSMDQANAAVANCDKVMHSAVRWGDRLIIYGGCSSVSSKVHEELYTFDLIKGTLNIAPKANVQEAPVRKERKGKKSRKGKEEQQPSSPTAVYQAPTGRYSHSALVIANEMYIHGGLNPSQSNGRLNDTWALSLTSWTWRRIENTFDTEIIDNINGYRNGTAPPPRTIQHRHPLMNSNSPKGQNEITISCQTDFLPPQREQQNSQPKPFQISTAMPKNEMDVWDHWKNELIVLQHENDEWQVNSHIDSSRLIDTYFLKRDEQIATGVSPNGITSPSRERARDAIYGGSVMLKKPWLDNPLWRSKISSPRKQFFVSPSITKLGLEGHLRHLHEKS